MKKFFSILTALLLFGCVQQPTGFESERFDFHNLNQAKNAINQCQCKTARIGGKILNAKAQSNRTKIEVLSLPVSNYTAQPLLERQSDGRFIAYLNGFVDPETLKNQYITVAGRLTTAEQGKIDTADYVYPVLQASQYRLWKVGQSYEYPDDWEFGYWRRPFGWRLQPEVKLNYYLY